MKHTTLGELFKGHEPILARIMESLEKGTSVKNIAIIYVKPIIEDLSKNAGTEMDSLYVAYACEYARLHIPPPSI